MFCVELEPWPVARVLTEGGTNAGGWTDPGACAAPGKVVVVYCTLTGVVGNAVK